VFELAFPLDRLLTSGVKAKYSWRKESHLLLLDEGKMRYCTVIHTGSISTSMLSSSMED
jgi:hypothetical protein